MTGYFFAGIFATACGFLLWMLYRAETGFTLYKADYEARVELLRAENKLLLNTALEARGVQVIDPQATQRNVKAVPRSVLTKVNAGLAQLAKEDAAKAMDRDARVAQEQDEARRMVEQMRIQAREQTGTEQGH